MIIVIDGKFHKNLSLYIEICKVSMVLRFNSICFYSIRRVCIILPESCNAAYTELFFILFTYVLQIIVFNNKM